MASYTPRDSATEQAFDGLLSVLSTVTPPGCDGDDLDDIAATVITAIRRDGTANSARLKATLNDALGAMLSDEAFSSIVELAMKVTDFMASDDANAARRAKNGADIRLEMEDSDSDSTGSDSESGSGSDSSSSRSAAPAGDRKRRRVDRAFADDGDDDLAAAPSPLDDSAARLSVLAIEDNPHFLRDDCLQPLFPSDTMAERQAKADRVLEFLANRSEATPTVQAQLANYLTRFDANLDEDIVEAEVTRLTANRWAIVYGTHLASFGPDQAALRDRLTEVMRGHAAVDSAVRDLYLGMTGLELKVANLAVQLRDPQLLDLRALRSAGERPVRNITPKVPKGTTQNNSAETHSELMLPATKTYREDMKELPMAAAFPPWCLRGIDLKQTPRLNPMQTHVHPTAFGSDDNLLVCAPTGAGKTQVALMTIFRAMSHYLANSDGTSFYFDRFKIVYIAPMKALVQEIVQTFSARLAPFGLTVAELSGDSGLSRQQLAATQMIVATPEKWDIVTRKSIEMGVAPLVRLIIIDEVHLLHNDRGPILESVVARTALQVAASGSPVRLVGLSATLPNFLDVATFLKVDHTKGLYNFDASYRPVPLRQSYCSVKNLSGKMPAEVHNMVAYEKVLRAGGESVMVFVHSRKDTEFTARYILGREKASNRLGRLVSELESVAEAVEAAGDDLRESLRELLPHGIGVHHAGMTKGERSIVERLYLERKIKVLVCTATLAWGVNLPANAVIIKGTQVYNPERGGKSPLSALDVLQMFGRAGRKGFGASEGEACIITTSDDVAYYLTVLNQQQPIESQFANHLVDALNAEISLRNVTCLADGAEWLTHTYYYVRAKKDPQLYRATKPSGAGAGAGAGAGVGADATLQAFREDLVHTAATTLRGCGMIAYDESSRAMQPTALGAIAATYYVHHESMQVYNRELTATATEIDLFHLFALSKEFAQIAVRREERPELAVLLQSCPIPIKEADPTKGAAKVNALLQCYITGLSLKGSHLMTELVYIKDSATRILKALYEMCIVRDFGATSRKVNAIYQMVMRQQWGVMCPLRQLLAPLRRQGTRDGMVAAGELAALVKRVEGRRDLEYARYRCASTVGDLVDGFRIDQGRASLLFDTMRMVPRILLEASTRPLAPGLLRIDVDLEIASDFNYQPFAHETASAEIVVSVEDATIVAGGGGAGNRRNILFTEIVDGSRLLRNAAGGGALPLSIVVPVPAANRPVHYFLYAYMPSWIGAEAQLPLTLQTIEAPRPLDAPLAPSGDAEAAVALAVGDALAEVAQSIYPFDTFRPQQAEAARRIAPTAPPSPWANLLVALPAGAGKTALAELLVMRLLAENDAQRQQPPPGGQPAPAPAEHLLCLVGTQPQARRRYDDWSVKFGLFLQQTVVLLTGNMTADGAALAAATAGGTDKTAIVIATAAALAPLVQRADPSLRAVRYLVADHLHLLGAGSAIAGGGATYEATLTRLVSKPYLCNGGSAPRLLALTYPVTYPRAVAAWLKVKPQNTLAFDDRVGRRLQVRVEATAIAGARNRAEYFRQVVMKRVATLPLYQSRRIGIFVGSAAEAARLAKEAADARPLLPDFGAEAGAAHDKGTEDVFIGGGAGGGDGDDCDDAAAPEAEETFASRVRAVASGRLRHCLKRGIAFLDASLAEADRATVTDLLEQGRVPLVVFCPVAAAWSLPAAIFHTAVVVAAERLLTGADATEENALQAFADTTLLEMTQMVTRGEAEAIVCARAARRWMWGALLSAPLPVSSNLSSAAAFEGPLNAAIAAVPAGAAPFANAQAAEAIQRHCFLQLLKANPAYYDFAKGNDATIRAGLSAITDAALDGLRSAGCILYDEAAEASVATSVGRAAARHCVQIDTVRDLARVESWEGVPPAEALRVVADMAEVSGLPCAAVQPRERGLLQRVAQALAIVATEEGLAFSEPGTKAYLLLRAALARGAFALPSVLAASPEGSREEDAAALAQLDADCRELLAAATRFATAAVEIVGHRSYVGARLFIALRAALVSESPADADATWALAPSVAPTGLLGRWVDAGLITDGGRAGGGFAPGALDAAATAAAAFLAGDQGVASGSDEAAALRSRASELVAAAAAQCAALQAACEHLPGAIIAATAEVVVEHGAPQLRVTARLRNPLSAASAAAPLPLWLLCFNRANPNSGLLGLAPVTMRPGGAGAADTEVVTMTMPIPDSAETEEVVPRVVLVPRAAALPPACALPEADVDMGLGGEEGGDDA